MRVARLITAVALAAVAAEGAVFVVPSDEELVAESAAIVVGVAGESQARRLPGRPIETVTTIEVTEALHGAIEGVTIEVVSLGGVLGTEGLLVHGTTRFHRGERVLLFLDRRREEWTTRGMAVGKFAFSGELLVRDSGEVCGYGRDGKPHREPYRAAEPFIRYVAATARGERVAPDYIVQAPPRAAANAAMQLQSTPVGTWLMTHGGRPLRWESFSTPAIFHSGGVQPKAAGGGLTAARRGMAAWTDDPGSSIVYLYGGTTTARSAFRSADGVNSILFNDPSEEVSQQGVLAVGGVHFSTATAHRFGSEEFLTILEADIVVQNDLALPGVAGPGFDRVLAHELGHTLGLRHSDAGPTGGVASMTAIMTSTIDFHGDRVGATLQAWDRDAAAAAYGSSHFASCSAPAIASEPSSLDLSAGPVTLSVSATGTGPLEYQWFIGSRGDTRSPIGGATSPSVSVEPAETTSYWVRVTGVCSPPADSATATVTVNGCPAVVISGVTASATIIQGRSQTLSISAESLNRTLTYRWFAGERGDKSVPAGTGPSIVVAPAHTVQYWAEVSNDCGATATTEAILIAVSPCTAPSIVTQPAHADAVMGESVALAANIRGSQPLVLQWYEGQPGDLSRPVPSAITASVVSPRIHAPTAFWLRARNECGEVHTSAAQVTIYPSCISPGIKVQPADAMVSPGGSAILSVDAAGPSLTYRWYQGPLYDYSHPVGVNAPQLVTPPVTEPTQFWVDIRNPCGGVSSTVATVTPSLARRRGAGR
ncbi:MAG TPA: hypothetical protein VNA04_03715 [Thermoanaerobaculia bacterium]|nr:hypothetical protein [Thermoanaerobaculia bacterium]